MHFFESIRPYSWGIDTNIQGFTNILTSIHVLPRDSVTPRGDQSWTTTLRKTTISLYYDMHCFFYAVALLVNKLFEFNVGMYALPLKIVPSMNALLNYIPSSIHAVT